MIQPDPNDLETLLSTDPLSLTKDPAQLDRVIAYFREWRQQVAAGAKPKKHSTDSGEVDLVELGLSQPKPMPKLTLRRRE